MAKVYEPYRRAPGTVDAGADFARQLDKKARNDARTLLTLEERVAALEAMLGSGLFVPPTSELVLNCTVPNDNALHTFPHQLGRAYRAAILAGHGLANETIITVWPAYVSDPTIEFGLQSLGPVAATSTIVHVWVF